MRKISKSRTDDDVVSSTNGSASVGNEENQESEQGVKDTNNEDNENGEEKDKSEDEKETSLEKETPKKSKSKKTKKKKSDKVNKKDAEEEYEVEKIMDSKKIKGKLHYLIRWKGYSADSDTWEPSNTLSCPEIISKYNEKENSKNTTPKKSSKRKGGKKDSKSSPKKTKTDWDSEDADENAEYEVERILEVHHKKNGTRDFLIHWKGWSNKFDSWEPEANLNCPELIKRFMEKVENAKTTESRSLRVAPETTNRFTLQDPTSGRRLSKRRGQRQRVRYDNAE